MSNRLWAILIFSVFASGVLLLSGCASVSQRVAPAEYLAGVRRIVLLDGVGPGQYRVTNIGSATSALGLVGALADIGTESQRATEFDGAVRASFDAATYAREGLTRALERRGYEVARLPGQHPVEKDGKGDYSGINSDGDPILEVAIITAGYTSEQFSTKYDPQIRAIARLGAPVTGEPLYFQVYNFGAKQGTTKGVRYIPPVSNSEFGTYRDLMDDLTATVAGLRAGLDAIVEDVALSLPLRARSSEPEGQ